MKSKEIHSVRPEYVGSSVSTGTVILTTTDIWFGYINGNPPGQVWASVQLQTPDPFPQVGTGCFVQMITADRHLWRTVGVAPDYTHFIKDPWNAQEALDQAFPYWGIIWNLPSTGTFQDSPKQPLGINWTNTHYWYKSTANDAFRTWALYKPPQMDGQPTVWIPMAQFAWAWTAVAERDPYPNGPWKLRSGSGQVSLQPTQTFDFPEWNKFSPGQFGFVPIN